MMITLKMEENKCWNASSLARQGSSETYKAANSDHHCCNVALFKMWKREKIFTKLFARGHFYFLVRRVALAEMFS